MCLPLCINTSSQTGRRYLIAYQPEFGQFKAYRLDYIKAADAVPDEKCPDYDTYAAQLRMCSAFPSGRRGSIRSLCA